MGTNRACVQEATGNTLPLRTELHLTSEHTATCRHCYSTFNAALVSTSHPGAEKPQLHSASPLLLHPCVLDASRRRPDAAGTGS